MARSRHVACALLLLAAPATAAAQAPPPPPQPPPAAPQPGAPQPGAPQPPAVYQQPAPPAAPQQPPVYQPAPGAYPQQPQGYPQPYPPGYGAPPPGYGTPYGYVPEGPPSPPPPAPVNLRWSVRMDPFELVMRRLTFQAEVAIVKFFAIEVAPSWIFSSPYSGVDEKGFTVAANAVFYLSGTAFRGLWLKAHFAYENFNATFTNPNASDLVGQPQRASSAILGVLFGDTFVVPRSGGFALSGGIGVGVATAGKMTLAAPGDPARGIAPVSTDLYEGFDRVRLLGTLGLGVAF